MFLPLAALLMIVSNIETVARTSEIWMPTLTAIEELPLSIINPEQKGETTFHVTIVDKQGKVVPNVKSKPRWRENNWTSRPEEMERPTSP